ncbi:putative P-loop containing nucleoside triphosphate hydrolase [Helianthus anomalus]
MEGGGSAAKSRYRTGIRIVVAGDPGSGKSSLILSAAKKIIRPNIPPVLPPTRLLEDMFCYRVPVTVIDTPSRY